MSTTEKLSRSYVITIQNDNVIITDGEKQIPIKYSWTTLFYHNGVYFTVRQELSDKTLLYYVYGSSDSHKNTLAKLKYIG